jgi:hypothetical protein
MCAMFGNNQEQYWQYIMMTVETNRLKAFTVLATQEQNI